MNVYRVEISPQVGASRTPDQHLTTLLHEAGLGGVTEARSSRLFFLEGGLSRDDAERIACELLADPVIESATVSTTDDEPQPIAAEQVALEVHPRPGVMDPVAESTLAELQAAGLPVEAVRTGRRHVFAGAVGQCDVTDAISRVLANDCVEQVVLGTAGVRPSPHPPVFEFRLRSVPLRDLDDSALEKLSRAAHLFLSLDEMRAIQQHYRALGREPTDLELETLAQTWSEHCVHKTLRSAVLYRGAPLPTGGTAGGSERAAGPTETRRYQNLLKDTIVRATEELVAAGRGPECLSVFKDNAGVIAFDDDFGVAFKVETHNHPSAIEPYGGAATGIGGVIRDVIGCGLGARPVANTDVFCVAPSDWPLDRLPKGVLHPGRILRGVVRGVADYGNRMGIPTVNGAVYFDPRYLGNPLVYCGCIGLIPRGMIEKDARPGDLVIVIGGRTGRDGIHGATFSSAELTDTHADEFSHAVQIGNAITEKRVLDAVLRARDGAGGCLYTAITDCGAGGLSSAVGEMGERTGAVIDLDKVPLKYAGLRYDEIWISEAQERMVVAVPREKLAPFLEIMREEEVEATVIGVFGAGELREDAVADGPRLVLRYQGHVVGDLDLDFLHHGVPKLERVAEWWPTEGAQPAQAAPPRFDTTGANPLDRLTHELPRPNTASKEWIIRQYDHEVQGGSAVKPLPGPDRGPGDAAVVCPRLGSLRGLVIGCGLVPHLADVDPYWMAAASIDEAIRNVVSAGGNPDRTAILDNFCWGRSDDPRQLGGLVRACQACHDVAKANGVPFISGKDSLNNEFALDETDVEPLLDTLRERAAGEGVDAERLRAILPGLQLRVRQRRRLSIPGTLLISAISVVDDVRRCVTPDLKRAGDHVLLIGGLHQTDYPLAAAAAVHRAVADVIGRGLAAACHDVADGGWLVALEEMAIAGDRGADIRIDASPRLDLVHRLLAGATHRDIRIDASPRLAPFEECCAGYLIETSQADQVTRLLESHGVSCADLALVRADHVVTSGGRGVEVAVLRRAWSGSGT